jgi:low temperature requirement protein LtrA
VGRTAARTLWHPHHIAERYGLLTLIVFGESILSATTAVQAAVAAGERLAALAPIIAGGCSSCTRSGGSTSTGRRTTC